jgi:hypothetical protein
MSSEEYVETFRETAMSSLIAKSSLSKHCMNLNTKHQDPSKRREALNLQ